MSRIQSDGETVGTVLLAFDVTEQEYAERNRREFTANVSHELKTPLTSIKGFTDMLPPAWWLSRDQKRFITMIGVEVDRLIDLINDILKLSELESVTIPQSEERSDVLTIARDTAAFLTPTAKRGGHPLRRRRSRYCGRPPGAAQGAAAQPGGQRHQVQ